MTLRKNTVYFVIFISIVMVFVYSSFYIRNHEQFNSPDETAQAYFIERISEGLSLASPIPGYTEGSVYTVPRSVRVVGETFVPASFLGLIGIYGIFAFLFGVSSVYLFSGVVAVLGLIAYYRIIAYIWGERMALPSLLLAFLFPGWWYYASLAFFPNVLLTSLVLWSIYSYILYKKSGKLRFSTGSGIVTALALFVRLAALPWIGIVWVALFILDMSLGRKEMIRFYSVWLITLFFIFLIPVVVIQKTLYGGIFETGYVLSETTSNETFVQALFPGGFHPRVAIRNFWDYYVMLFWYIMIPSLLGAFYFCIRSKSATLLQRRYVALVGLVSLWLILYYGSWTLTDNINNDTTIGVAYVRYWLPIYLLALPFSVFGFQKLISCNVTSKLSLLLGVFAFLIYGTLSTGSVYSRYDDSLAAVETTLKQNNWIKQEVLAVTKEDAVIISYRHDKLFFPDRDVMHLKLNVIDGEVLLKIMLEREVYWYTLLESEIIEADIAQTLKEVQIDIVEVKKIDKGLLYAFTSN